MKITFLGCGGSLGVPMLGCDCHVCRSDDPRNRRYRPSIWLRYGDHSVLIDVAPEFRLQALENGIERIDAVLFTHAHADHCLGMDDLRIVIDFSRRRIPVYASEETLRSLQQTFGYLFASRIWGSKKMRLESIAVNGPFDLSGVKFEPLEVWHDKERVTGFRFGRAAYITDASAVPDETAEMVKNMDLLIISALRYKPHPKHFGLEDALRFIERVRPGKALLTHMSHEFDYESLERELPEGVAPAFDRLTIEI